MIDIITHCNYLVHEQEIEELRQFHENIAREDDPTAIGVMVLEGMGYDEWPGVKKAKAEGYHIVDANAFGFGDELMGEILIMSKNRNYHFDKKIMENVRSVEILKDSVVKELAEGILKKYGFRREKCVDLAMQASWWYKDYTIEELKAIDKNALLEQVCKEIDNNVII